MSADDFGVMPRSTLLLRSGNKALEHRKPKELERCLSVLETVGLVARFEHQGDVYLFQPMWQDYQAITWPAKTQNPRVPADKLETCSEATRMLIDAYPGAKKAVLPLKEERRSSVRTPEVLQSSSGGTSATRETLTLTPNPIPSSLEKKEIEKGPRPLDLWLRQLHDRYPEYRRTTGHMTEVAFMNQLLAFDGGVDAAWILMQANLELNIVSHEWRVKGMVPKLEKYLREGLWRNALPSEPPTGERLTAKSNRTLQGASDALRSAS
jgi:hypothetical protein